jgi:hypothetical protein
MKQRLNTFDRLPEGQWPYRPASRLLKRLYTELERQEALLGWEQVKRYCPEHRPTDFRERQATCLARKHRIWDLQARIDRAQNR